MDLFIKSKQFFRKNLLLEDHIVPASFPIDTFINTIDTAVLKLDLNKLTIGQQSKKIALLFKGTGLKKLSYHVYKVLNKDIH